MKKKESCDITDCLKFQKLPCIVHVFTMCVVSVYPVCVLQWLFLCCRKMSKNKRVKRITPMRVWYGHVCMCVYVLWEKIKRGRRIICIFKCLWNEIFFFFTSNCCVKKVHDRGDRRGALCVLFQLLSVWETFFFFLALNICVVRIGVTTERMIRFTSNIQMFGKRFLLLTFAQSS